MLTTSFAAGPPLPALPRQTLGDLLRETAARVPAQLALVSDRASEGCPQSYTYAELLHHSERCARRLLTRFQPGERIAIWSDNRAEWLVLMLGAALARLVVVTVNPALRVQEARHVLGQSRSAACFAVSGFRGARLAEIAAGFVGELPELREVHRFEDWREFMSGPLFAGDLPSVDADDPLMIQYTSGTTGLPKGALLLHGRLVNNSRMSTLRAGVPENAVWMLPMPFFHVAGTVLTSMAAVGRRATLVLLSAWNPEDAMRMIQDQRVEVMTAVPTQLIGILRHELRQQYDLRTLKLIVTGGYTVPAALVRELSDENGIEVSIVFGQTESGPVATMTEPRDTPEDKQNTVGTAMPGVEIRIADPETGATVAIGEHGEFLVRHGVMAGYFDNEAATREAIDADGWLHTGDLCSMDERGYVSVQGRLRDMIIRGGENIYPREIEEVIAADPRIADVAVVGVPDEVWGETVAAFVVLAPDAALDTEAYTAELRGKLARFKIPQRWIVIDELPRTMSGKVQKFRLRDDWKAGRYSAQATQAAPVGAGEPAATR